MEPTSNGKGEEGRTRRRGRASDVEKGDPPTGLSSYATATPTLLQL